MKQGSKFTARRERNKREEEQERENESHQRRWERRVGRSQLPQEEYGRERKCGKKQKDEKVKALFMNKWQMRCNCTIFVYLSLSLSIAETHWGAPVHLN